MSVVQGVVQQISRRGKATNVKVNNQWFGCGFDGVPCGEGDEVSFGVVQNGQYVNADMNSFQVIRQSQGVPGNAQPQASQTQGNNQGYANRGGGNAGASGGAGRGGSSNRGGYRKDLKDPVQVSITQQSARNAAIELVRVLFENDAAPIPKTKKADQFDAVLDLVDIIEERFYKKTVAVAKAGGYPEEQAATPQQAQVAQQAQGGNDAPNPPADFDDDIPF